MIPAKHVAMFVQTTLQNMLLCLYYELWEVYGYLCANDFPNDPCKAYGYVCANNPCNTRGYVCANGFCKACGSVCTFVKKFLVERRSILTIQTKTQT